MYECIIIGGGPAGLSAGVYLARKKMKIVVISSEIGGQTAKASSVENYLGMEKINGAELMTKFHDHLKSYSVEEKTGSVVSVEKKDKSFEVKLGEETLEAKSIIIASGKAPRHLNVPGEKEFSGKGISYCATCDGPLFSDKTVTVIGGGNSALDAALELEKYAKKVYIVNLNETFQGDEIRVDQVNKASKIEVIHQAETVEFTGDKFLKTLKYKDLKTSEEKEIATDGAFVDIGWVPSSDFIKELVEINATGEIEIDKLNKTSCEGIYAAGDVTDIPFKQIIIAAGEGAKASLECWKYIITNKISN